MKRLVVAVALMGLASTAFAQQPEVVEFCGKDVVGSIRIVYDASGNIVGRQDYTPFGTPVLNGKSMPTEGFGGNEKDDETQQMYFHARMRRASIGRFRRVDPAQPDPHGPSTMESVRVRAQPSLHLLRSHRFERESLARFVVLSGGGFIRRLRRLAVMAG